MATTRQVPAFLTWKQSKATQRSYDLVSAEGSLASLRFLKLTGTLAEAQVNGVGYSFKRTGFLHPKITMRREPFEQDIGVVDVSWKGTGIVSMSNGRRYSFDRPSMWAGRWEVLDDNDEVLATVKLLRVLLKNEAEVTVQEKGAKHSDMLLLLAVQWYMIMLIQQEGATAAAGST